MRDKNKTTIILSLHVSVGRHVQTEEPYGHHDNLLFCSNQYAENKINMKICGDVRLSQDELAQLCRSASLIVHLCTQPAKPSVN